MIPRFCLSRIEYFFHAKFASSTYEQADDVIGTESSRDLVVQGSLSAKSRDVVL